MVFETYLTYTKASVNIKMLFPSLSALEIAISGGVWRRTLGQSHLLTDPEFMWYSWQTKCFVSKPCCAYAY